MTESAIKIINLTKKFEDKLALDDLTLEIQKVNSSGCWDQTAQAKPPP